MKQESENQKGSTKKKVIAYLGGLFIVCVIILSFFSKTIAGLSLQKVTIAKGKMSYLEQEASYEGKAAFEKAYKVYAPAECKITEIDVKVGDQVKKGQLLCKVEGDDSQYELEQKQLVIEKNELETKHLEEKLSDLGMQCEKAQQKLEDLKQKAQSDEDKRKQEAGNNAKDENELDLEAAEKTLEVDQELFKAGALSEADLKAAETAVEKIKLKMSQDKADKEKEEQSETEASKTAIESQETAVETLLAQKKQTEQEIENNALTLKGLQLELNHLKETMPSSGAILATSDGIVLELKIDEGEQVTKQQEMISIADLAAGEKAVFAIEENQKLLAIGDTVHLSIPILKQNQIEGSVTAIKNDETGLIAEAHFECPEVTGNEKVEVRVNKQSDEEHLIMPYSAINKEKTGYFVYEVVPMEDAMGSSYKVVKSRVEIGGHSLDSVEIISGITQSTCVVVSSEKAVQEGMRVKVENEEVFYDEAPDK